MKCVMLKCFDCIYIELFQTCGVRAHV